jgi:hypothetical protein
MFRMAVGHSDEIDVEDALEAVFRECDAALDGRAPKAGLLLVAYDVDQQAVIDGIRGRYPDIELAGATSAGEMSSIHGFTEDSVVLALFAADAVDMTSGLGTGLAADPLGATRQAVEDARGKTNLTPKLCIVMPTIGLVEARVILEGLRAVLGPDVPILGGGAAPRDPAADPTSGVGVSRQIAGNVVVEDAISILLLSGPIAFSFGVHTGWRGVGPRANVTRVTSDGFVEIDGRPAIEFYRRYLGSAGPAIANPLAVFETPESDRFYLRTPVGYEEGTGRVTFFGSVPEGATVQITVAAPDEIFDGAAASIADALATFPAGRTPEAALLYSCATRRYLLGTRAGHEIELIRDALGPDVPIAGLYCMGEIAPLAPAGPSLFHNATMVSVLLGEEPGVGPAA